MVRENQTDVTSENTKGRQNATPISQPSNAGKVVMSAEASKLTVMADNLAFAQDLIASWQGAVWMQMDGFLLVALPVFGHVIGEKSTERGKVFTIDGTPIYDAPVRTVLK